MSEQGSKNLGKSKGDGIWFPDDWCEICALTPYMASLNLCERMKLVSCRKLTGGQELEDIKDIKK